ncbi:hypothetical protein ACI2S5_12890 [Ralstonia nicotianae]|uniref:hypothetical protein n=1 Tax=Ralstonia solanacearum species complex TaxID=3116862 RepID=UPI00037254AE|nr:MULTISPECIES: hypothetical protein [Ralstonia]AXV74810.1 hypothetical protein CJO75_18135 [Ralstonia solanacearum]AXW16639.1 hypothetical protein CJO84_18395 [Ralstonia solanacearum]AXW40308.1 hypothetical protein CJO89_18755 [Ralstonia solanacearum]AXW73101.1 hypothetical protein CJO96_18100 [Ralstonia solanacearum]MCK4122828.1 hypothetical protein [Ralstonia pseudosolanacearum]
MPCPTTPPERSTPPDTPPRHRDDPPPARPWWLPVARMSAAAAFVAAIPHADVPLPFKDGAWMLHMAAALIFMVGVIDSLFLFISARRKL